MTVLRVLLAEDNPIGQAVVRLMLEGEGCQVTVVCDGSEAAQAAMQDDYHLLLMDVQMPVLSGLEATQAIRRWERQSGRQSVTIVALTVLAEEEDRRRSVDAGMNGFLSKPVRLDDLRQLLGSLRTESEATRDLPLFDRPKALETFATESILGAALGDFFSRAQVVLNELVSASQDGRDSVVREKAHWFRGGAVYLFSPRVLAACEELSRLSGQEPIPPLQPALDDLRRALGQLEEWVLSSGGPGT